MSEERKQEALDEIKEALAEVPDKYHREVARSLIHDINVMSQAIRIAEARSA